MFEKEQTLVKTQVSAILKEAGVPDEPLKWTWIPFSAHWGIATSLFATASKEAKAGKPVNVKARATELAEMVKDKLQLPPEFEKVEAVNGYINLYFDSQIFAKQVVDRVLEQDKDFGRGEATGKNVMVE
jgi:arginyl-tRNA synthetase